MYQIMESLRGNIVILNVDGTLVSFDENPENSDYQAYLEWVAAGNTPEVIEG